MEVKLAESAGFCWGVNRAFNKVLETVTQKEGKEGRIATFGPLIHNPQAVEHLKEKGVDIVQEISEVGPGDIIITRSHGVAPEIKKELQRIDCTIVDATCPRVSRVQTLVKEYSQKGFTVIIMGDKGHAEVEALVAHSKGKAIVLEEVAELEELSVEGDLCFVFQTTYNLAKFEEAKEIIKSRYPNAKLFNTICEATSLRQKGLLELAPQVDCLVVVGGRNSANTRRLYDIAKGTGKPSFFVEYPREIDILDLSQYKSAGVSAGASTPSWVIQEVVEKLQSIGEKKLTIWQRRKFKNIAYYFLQSNIYTAVGAFVFLLGIYRKLEAPLFFGLFYLLGLHTLNNIREWVKTPIGDVHKVKFFSRRQKSMKLYSFLSIGLAIISAFTMTTFQGLIVSLLTIATGIFYVSWEVLRKLIKRELAIFLGWLMVLVVIPLLELNPYSEYPYLIFVAVALTALRSIISSLKEIKSDRVLGKESMVNQSNLPLWESVSYMILGLLILLLLIISSVDKPIYLALLIPVLYLLIILRNIGDLRPSLIELFTDGAFFLTGFFLLLFF